MNRTNLLTRVEGPPAVILAHLKSEATLWLSDEGFVVFRFGESYESVDFAIMWGLYHEEKDLIILKRFLFDSPGLIIDLCAVKGFSDTGGEFHELSEQYRDEQQQELCLCMNADFKNLLLDMYGGNLEGLLTFTSVEEGLAYLRSCIDGA